MSDLCKVADCKSLSHCKGYCCHHYQVLVRKHYPASKGCSEPGCSAKHNARGYCRHHYDNIYRANKDYGVCSESGCSKPVHFNHTKSKLCLSHGGMKYVRMYKKMGYSAGGRDSKFKLPAQYDMDTEFPKAHIGAMARLHYGPKCMKCGWDKAPCHGHHIVPQADGGSNTLRNMIVLCPNCHLLAHVELRVAKMSAKYGASFK